VLIGKDSGPRVDACSTAQGEKNPSISKKHTHFTTLGRGVFKESSFGTFSINHTVDCFAKV
jgi:hypothetical protein